MASSRVGEITSVPVPLRGMNRARCISSMQGTRNASVFPEPAWYCTSAAIVPAHTLSGDGPQHLHDEAPSLLQLPD